MFACLYVCICMCLFCWSYTRFPGNLNTAHFPLLAYPPNCHKGEPLPTASLLHSFHTDLHNISQIYLYISRICHLPAIVDHGRGLDSFPFVRLLVLLLLLLLSFFSLCVNFSLCFKRDNFFYKICLRGMTVVVPTDATSLCQETLFNFVHIFVIIVCEHLAVL